MSERLLVMKNVSDMLNVSAPTVYRLMHRQEDPLPYMKIGTALRFPESAVLAWIERQVKR